MHSLKLQYIWIVINYNNIISYDYDLKSYIITGKPDFISSL